MKAWWRKWSYEIPLAISDALWDVLVVQLAAMLDRLTARRVIALIPIAILVLAYYHRIPIPPELMLVGDLLAYIDIFSVIFLLGVLSRAATLMLIAKQTTARAAALASRLLAALHRRDIRHRREGGAGKSKRPTRRAVDDEDGPAFGTAWDRLATA